MRFGNVLLFVVLNAFVKVKLVKLELHIGVASIAYRKAKLNYIMPMDSSQIIDNDVTALNTTFQSICILGASNVTLINRCKLFS